MESSAGATELAREGVTLLLLHVPPSTPSLASTPRCSRSAPGSEGSRWCRQLVYKCGNDNWRTSAGRGVASKRFFCGKFTCLDHTIWILLETGNNFQATCHGVSLNALSQLDEKLQLRWRHHGWMDRAPQTDMERRLVEQPREENFAKKSPAQPERRGCYSTHLSLLRLST